jgi:outer membrane protein assembly factor BamB
MLKASRFLAENKAMNKRLYLAFPAFLFIPLFFLNGQEFDSEPIWRRALGGAVTGHPVAQAESVVATTDGGNLKSFSSQGTPLWDYYARGRLLPFVSRSGEGTSYICRTNGTFIAINRSGRELWQIDLGPLVCPALIGWDGRLFAFTDHKITCMTAAGFKLWSRALETSFAIEPFSDAAGGVILATEDGKILRFDPFGNTFSYSADSLPRAAVSLDIEDKGHSILLLYEDRHLELVYPYLGYSESLRGKLDLPSPPVAAAGSSVAGRKDEAAVLLQDGRVALVSLGKRSLLWTADSHASSSEVSDIARNLRSNEKQLDFFCDERGVYLLTKNGASGFTPDGRRLWFTRLRGAAAIPSFGDDGVLYSGGADWVLYAYKLEDRQALHYGEAGSYGTGNPGPSSFASYHYRLAERELDERLAEISDAIKRGEVGALEKEYAAWLMETAGSAVANGNYAAHIRYRAEAARLLAFIGSRETIPFLANLFARDPEPFVRASAAEAIGRIGVDPEGIAMKALSAAVFPPFPAAEETVLTAAAQAAGALSRFSGPPLSGDGLRILAYLAGDDKPPRTRSRAQREIESLGRP